jgi:transposase
MIDYQQFCHIKDLHANQGLTVAQIAGALSLDPRTVAYWLTQERFRRRHAPPRASKLDPLKPQILQMLEKYPYSAQQIFQRLRHQGFDGGYSIVKAYGRTVRPKRQGAFLTLAFAPGECAHVDWSSFGAVPVGHTSRRLSFFVLVLCYSRLMYVECTVSQTMEHFLACHQHAFAYINGVPKTIMVDTLKSAVLKRARGQAPVCNPKYMDFSKHHGFRIVPCNVGKGHEKGRVENGGGYVKKNFLVGLDIADFSGLNAAARHWLDTVANVRLHGETRKPPPQLWQAEKPSLLPLPTQPFDTATISQVRASRQFRITLDTNHSSVPAHLAGQALTLKTYPDRLCLYHHNQLVARHQRSYDRHGDFEDPDHPKPLVEQRKKAGDHKLFMRFLALSPQAELYYRQLEERRLNPHHHGRKIVALSDIYSHEDVARALADAMDYGAFAADYIANLLEQRARFTPQQRPLHLTRREDVLDLHLQPPDLSVYQENTTTLDHSV